MFITNILNFFKKTNKKETANANSKDTAKERLHLVLMQDRANVSVDFLDLMRQEIIEVIKKYIDIDEKAMDVRLTNQENEDGTQGAPALYANIPIINIKEKTKKLSDEKEKVGENNNTKKEQEKKTDTENKEKEAENKVEENKKVQDNKEEKENKEEKKQGEVENKPEEVSDANNKDNVEKTEEIKEPETEHKEEPPKEEKENNPKKESENE